jgi:hypothetical protein
VRALEHGSHAEVDAVAARDGKRIDPRRRLRGAVAGGDRLGPELRAVVLDGDAHAVRGACRRAAWRLTSPVILICPVNGATHRRTVSWSGALSSMTSSVPSKSGSSPLPSTDPGPTGTGEV